ncbi:MAG TPA: phosphoribosylaminoimidazolesuccinocarboxamide synthase [Candidatus Hypogeohydataceae bacterium YC40]
MKPGYDILLETHLPVPLLKRGKVRDIYELKNDLLIVATDRISVFDVILPSPIPGKGKILTALSEFWFKKLEHLAPSHLITTDVKEMGKTVQAFADILEGRSMLVKKADPLPVECVVRGYLAGSAWKEYETTGMCQGVKLPPGLRQSERLPEPIFTPATKAPTEHDENIPISRVKEMLGEKFTREIMEKSIALFKEASTYAFDRRIIIADAKLEWGRVGNGLILIDEVFTPDSSRFWPLENYTPGQPQVSFDKQYVRDFVEQVGWDKNPPAPFLSKEVVHKTLEKYLEAYRRLTGKELSL